MTPAKKQPVTINTKKGAPQNVEHTILKSSPEQASVWRIKGRGAQPVFKAQSIPNCSTAWRQEVKWLWSHSSLTCNKMFPKQDTTRQRWAGSLETANLVFWGRGRREQFAQNRLHTNSIVKAKSVVLQTGLSLLQKAPTPPILISSLEGSGKDRSYNLWNANCTVLLILKGYTMTHKTYSKTGCYSIFHHNRRASMG